MPLIQLYLSKQAAVSKPKPINVQISQQKPYQKTINSKSLGSTPPAAKYNLIIPILKVCWIF